MKCKNCHYDNMDGANFCIQCGTRLEPQEETGQENQLVPEELEMSSSEMDTVYQEPVIDLEPLLETETVDDPARSSGFVMEDVSQNMDPTLEPSSETAGSALDDLSQSLEKEPEPYQPAASHLRSSDEPLWYYVDQGASAGPFTMAQMLEKASTGLLNGQTYVWTKGLPDWIRLSDSALAGILPSNRSQPDFESPRSSWTGSQSSDARSSFQGTASSLEQTIHQTAQSAQSAFKAASQKAQAAMAQAAGGLDDLLQNRNTQENATDAWFCVQDNRSTGPYSAEVIGQMLANHTISPTTYVWKEGMQDWDLLRNTSLASYLSRSESSQPYWTGSTTPDYSQKTSVSPESGTTRVRERSILWSIVLTIVTCGLWGMIWEYQAAKDVNVLAAEQRRPGGPDPLIAVLLSIVTCGIYNVYFFYKEGVTISAIQSGGSQDQSPGLLGLLLALLGFFLPVVALAVLQDMINDTVRTLRG